MPEGVQVEIVNGRAEITPDPGKRSEVVTKLLGAVDNRSQIRVDTGGRRRSFHVDEDIARKAGLVDEDITATEPSKKAPAKKTTAKKPPTKPVDPQPDQRTDTTDTAADAAERQVTAEKAAAAEHAALEAKLAE